MFDGFNTLRPGQNCRHFPDDIFTYIFLNENVRNLKIRWSLFLMLQLTIFHSSSGSDNVLAPTGWLAIIWTNYG